MLNRFQAIAVACLVALMLALSAAPSSAVQKIADRVRQTSTTAGTGTLTLNSPAVTDRSFASAIGVGNTTYYGIDDGGGNWEYGVGTVGASSLSRDTVIISSNGTSLVNFPAGIKTVGVIIPATRYLWMASPLSPVTGDVLVYDGGWTNVPGSTALATARTKLGAVPTTRQIICSGGITGCGDFSADRTIAAPFGTTSGTFAQGNDSRITGAMQQSANGSDIANAATFRTNTGTAYGTAAGTVAQGNDSRITSAVPNTRTVIAGTGLLGGGALSGNVTLTANFGTANNTIAEGNDARIVRALQTVNDLSDLHSVPIARGNLGLNSGWIRGWALIAGGSSPSITGGDAASVSRSATGVYSVNWGTAISGNYAALIECSDGTGTTPYGVAWTVKTTTRVQFTCINALSGAARDPDNIVVQAFE